MLNDVINLLVVVKFVLGHSLVVVFADGYYCLYILFFKASHLSKPCMRFGH